MTNENLRRAVTLFGIVIPALSVAAAEKNVTNDEAINGCVEMRERLFECKEPFIDAMIDLRLSRSGRTVTPAEKAAMRAEGLREIAADGSGPRPPRAEKCATIVGKTKTDKAAVAALKACYAESDCTKRVVCLMPVVEALTFGKK